MVSFSIRLAGVNVSIRCRCPSTKEFCGAYLTQEPPDVSVEIRPEDISLEQVLSDQTSLREGRAPAAYPKPYLETLAVLRKLADPLLGHHVLLFHGSAVAVATHNRTPLAVNCFKYCSTPGFRGRSVR